MALFEGYERRIDKITAFLEQNGMKTLDEAKALCDGKGVDVFQIVKDVQPICFENACWAYTLGAALAIKRGQTNAVEIAATLGEGLQAFCIPGSVAEHRLVGQGHGNLASMLLNEDTNCFAFLAGHESFAAAEGAIGLAKSANRVRTKPLRVILNGLGKDAAQIISRVNGFTHVQTAYDYASGELKIVKEKAYSTSERSKVRCYGSDDVREGVAGSGGRRDCHGRSCVRSCRSVALQCGVQRVRTPAGPSFRACPHARRARASEADSRIDRR